MNSKTKNPTEIINSFASLKVMVVGEAMLDSYLIGNTGRICREAPVPVVSLTTRDDAPGGAANTALNAASLGANVTFISVVGDDREGQTLRQNLEQAGVETQYLLTQPGRQTLAKCRVIASSQMLLRFDQGSSENLNANTEQALIKNIEKIWPECNAIIISDYCYGIFTPRVLSCLTSLQQRFPRILVADSKRLSVYSEVGITACKPNYEEALQLLGAKASESQEERVQFICNNAENLLKVTGARMVAVTLDTDGALLLERNQAIYRTYAKPCPNSRAAGAGDTFVSALTLALASDINSTTAIEIASAAAAIVVSRDGTSACSISELREHFSANSHSLTNLTGLCRQLEVYRQQKRRIVFTNGCFDILHRGHIAFLNQAKALGDVLIVAINSDDSVRRLKGEGRPVNTLEDRLTIMEALSCIDHIVTFEEDTPVALLEAIRPDIFVKGGDYLLEMIKEVPIVEQYGGRVQILPYLPERSTSLIIQRIKESVQANPETLDSFDAVEESAFASSNKLNLQSEAVVPSSYGNMQMYDAM